LSEFIRYFKKGICGGESYKTNFVNERREEAIMWRITIRILSSLKGSGVSEGFYLHELSFLNSGLNLLA